MIKTIKEYLEMCEVRNQLLKEEKMLRNRINNIETAIISFSSTNEFKEYVVKQVLEKTGTNGEIIK